MATKMWKMKLPTAVFVEPNTRHRVMLGLLLVVLFAPSTASAFFFDLFEPDRVEPDRVILYNALKKGDVGLSANGVGKINGPAVKGWLFNNTTEEKLVNVSLLLPIYLENSDQSAQNMIATRVYRLGATGRLPPKENDEGEYILLREKEHVPIVFIAYCADQEKSTPDISDSFTARSLPSEFWPIIIKIKQYRTQPENKGVDIFDGAQTAIWHFQEEPIRVTRRLLDIDSADVRIANEILRQ